MAETSTVRPNGMVREDIDVRGNAATQLPPNAELHCDCGGFYLAFYYWYGRLTHGLKLSGL